MHCLLNPGMTSIPTFNSKNGTKLLTVLSPWLWPQRSCLHLGPRAGPSLTHERCWKSVNWRRAARVPHAVSRTPVFCPRGARLGRCSRSSRSATRLCPQTTPLLGSGRSLVSSDSSFGPAGLRPARPHPSSDLSMWVSESCSLGPMALHSAAMQTAVPRRCGET